MKKASMLTVLVLTMVVTLFSSGVPSTKAATTYQNPVLAASGDPSALKYDGWFYVYLPDAYADGSGGRVLCWKSKDLVNWTSVGEVFNNRDEAYGGHSTIGLWAPSVHYINGKFYLYYVNNMNNPKDPDIGDKDICVVAGTSPTSFDPSTREVLLNGDYAFIDPMCFQNDNGNIFLYFKVRDGSPGGTKICVREMTGPKQFGAENRIQLLKSDDVPNSYNILEHPWLEKKGDDYILFFSYGHGNDTSYKIGYAKSKSPKGPFTLSPDNPIMQTNPVGSTNPVIAPGATSIVLDGSGNRWMVYRQKDDRQENWQRSVCIDRVIIGAAGNVTITDTRGTIQDAPTPLP